MSSKTPSPSHALHNSAQNRQILLTHGRLLHLIHHRNHNQHRRSIWYRHFNSFRREVHQLCLELDLPLVPISESVNKSPSHPKQVKLDSSTIIEEKRKDREHAKRSQDAVKRRLLHWRDSELIVKWFSAFSHLPSTPHSSQFAPLGLVLLAILGRVAALTGLTASLEKLGDEQEDLEAEEVRMAIEKFGEEANVLLGGDKGAGIPGDRQEDGDDSMEDLGVPIAFDDG